MEDDRDVPPRTLSERELGDAAGEADLSSASDVEIAFDAFDALDPDALQSCRALTHLSLTHNGLRVLPRLHAAADTLRRLELSHQRLESMSGLPELPQLRELILNDNAIATLEPPAGCPRLERLWLFSNRVERLAGLDRLSSLRELWLQDNRVRRLRGAGLERLVDLRELALAGNPIHDLGEIDALASVPALRRLSFADRFFAPAPVTTRRGYRAATTRTLPQLEILDEFEVREDERGGAADDRLRAALDFNRGVEEARREHAAEVTALEAARDRSAAAAAAAGSRAAAKLRKLEKTVRAGREMVLAAAERAAARREDARRALHERLADIGAEHARAVDAMVRRAEAAAAAETSRYERFARRARFARESAEARAALLDDGTTLLAAHSNAARAVFELSEEDAEMREVCEAFAAAAAAAGELPPKRAATASESRKTKSEERIPDADEDDDDGFALGPVVAFAVHRVVDAEATLAFERARTTASSADGDETPARMETRTAFLGTTPSGVRAALSSGLDAAAASGALGSTADDRGVRLWRTVAQAYDAAKLALASEDARKPTAEDEARATELEGPAAVFACVVAADDDVVAAWDRIAPRWRRGPVATSAVFARGRALLKYVVHVERAATTTASARRTSRSRTDAAAMDAADAAELRSLEARAEAEVRQFRYDAWRAADPGVAEIVAAQDEELDQLRAELAATRAAVAEEKAKQEDAERWGSENARADAETFATTW